MEIDIMAKFHYCVAYQCSLYDIPLREGVCGVIEKICIPRWRFRPLRGATLNCRHIMYPSGTPQYPREVRPLCTC